MKRLLLIHFFLFSFTWLFTVNAFSQALPDPGNDPIEPVDTIVKSNSVKPNVSVYKAATKFTVSKAPARALEDTAEYCPVYKPEDLLNRSLK